MMKASLVCLCLVLGAAVSVEISTGYSKTRFLRDDFISQINNAETTWKAKRNFPVDTPYEHFQKLASLKGISNDPDYKLPVKTLKVGALPDSFDARTQWPSCTSISTIRNQGACGSCWAFGAVEAMSDRLCIATGEQFTFAPEELVSCCSACGFGCNGGYLLQAWQYWATKGIVSGGDEGSALGCRPYTSASTGVTPACKQECVATYDKTFKEDLKFGVKAYSVSSNEEQIKQEVYDNGPVEVAFTVYEDFYDYESGVYQHVSGGVVGGHAVKLLGWGEENGTPYWLIANSWDTNWGDQGYFKIIRGSNHCGIESNVVGGTPSA